MTPDWIMSSNLSARADGTAATSVAVMAIRVRRFLSDMTGSPSKNSERKAVWLRNGFVNLPPRLPRKADEAVTGAAMAEDRRSSGGLRASQQFAPIREASTPDLSIVPSRRQVSTGTEKGRDHAEGREESLRLPR